VGTELLHVDGRKDRQEEANKEFFAILPMHIKRTGKEKRFCIQ